MALPVAVSATVVRYLLNHYIAGCRLGVKASPSNKAAIMLEEVWLLVCSTLLLCLSTWASESGYNARCSLLDQAGCFDGWPEQHHSSQVTVVMAAFIGWYIHGVAKSLIPGVALRSGALAAPTLSTRAQTLQQFAATVGWLTDALLSTARLQRKAHCAPMKQRAKHIATHTLPCAPSPTRTSRMQAST